MQHHALIPGSFDPVTEGHMDLIRRAAAAFDTVTVCVFINPDKNEPLLSVGQRTALLRAACAPYANVHVDSCTGYVADYVDAHGICAVVKGVRNAADLSYEIGQADYNRRRNPAAETLFFPALPGREELSATEVRRRIAAGESCDGLVPAEALALLRDFLD